MPYEYSYSRVDAGTVWFWKSTYVFYQTGLIRLRDHLQQWNQQEVEPPYRREGEDLTNMIEWAQPRLAQLSADDDEFTVPGISVGSLRYLKAAAMIQILEAEQELQQNFTTLPNGVKTSRRRWIQEKKRLADIGRLKDLDPADILWEIAPSPVSRVSLSREGTGHEYEWDIFLCHATEDKECFVTNLVVALDTAGLRVWYDEFELRLGDSLRRSIERGLLRSHYGVVVLSPRFFEKEWPQRELDGMAALEVDGRRVILPVWLDLTVTNVRARSPMLADRVAISASEGIPAVAQAILNAIRPPTGHS